MYLFIYLFLYLFEILFIVPENMKMDFFNGIVYVWFQRQKPVFLFIVRFVVW